MNSPPLLLPPPLVINRDRVRTTAAAPLSLRSVKIRPLKLVVVCFFVYLSLVFIWRVGKKDLSRKNFFVPKNQHRNQIDERLKVGIESQFFAVIISYLQLSPVIDSYRQLLAVTDRYWPGGRFLSFAKSD